MAASTSGTNLSDNQVSGNLIPVSIIPSLCMAHLTGIGFASTNNFLCSPCKVASTAIASALAPLVAS